MAVSRCPLRRSVRHDIENRKDSTIEQYYNGDAFERPYLIFSKYFVIIIIEKLRILLFS